MKRFNSSPLSSGPALAHAGSTPSDNVSSLKHGSVEDARRIQTGSSLRYGNQSATEHRPVLNVTSTLGSGRSPLPWWKQAVDCVGCLVGLPLLAMGTIAWSLVARYSSPGPVLYRQERVGYMGRRFWMYKFRTMTLCGTSPTKNHSIANIDRTDGLVATAKSRRHAGQMPGAWLLRSAAFDQLPQILNVLRGEMSFVGPRPCTATELENSVRWQRARFDTLPGLTGLGQVSGEKNVSPAENIRMDVHYVRSVSFWMDAKIMLLTVAHLLARILDAHRAIRSSPRSEYSNFSTLQDGIIPSETSRQSYS